MGHFQTTTKYEEKRKLYNDSRNTIKAVWPQMHKLIETINPRISDKSPKEFESVSNPKVFGEVLYDMKSNDPIKWGEILVHEIGHQYLFVTTSTKNLAPFKQIFKDRRFSHLRDEQRPLIGIYHAVMAQTCMIELALRILKKKKKEIKHSSARKILAKFKDVFPLDLKTIEECKLLEFDHHIADFILEVKEKFDLYFSRETA
ncbi:MAG: hypothetical protein OXB88_06600 [Bacteriovoracales bacterium]|nr:hypothetical protein [Bacteriovoracales bacterium]